MSVIQDQHSSSDGPRVAEAAPNRLRHAATQVLYGAIGIALITFAAIQFHLQRTVPEPGAGPGTVSLLFLVVIVFASHRAGFVASVAVSLIAALCFSFFILPLVPALEVKNPLDIVATVVFLFAAWTITGTVARVRKLNEKLTIDVTALKRAENELRRSEAYLAAGQRLSRTGSWAWIVGADKLFWSQETFRIFGFDPANTTASLAKTFLSRIHPQDLSKIEQGLEQTQNFSVDYRIVLPDGSIKHIHDVVYTAANEAGQIIERYGVVMDMTDRKLAEEERERSFDQLRALAGRLQRAREEEGARISRELHDELGSALTTLKWDEEGLLQFVTSGGDQASSPIVQSRLLAIISHTDSIMNAVKRIASELRPGFLDDLGLIAAIEAQAQEFQTRTGITSRFDSTLDSINLSRDRAIAVFRIFQETLTNILRHANATQVDISADEQPGEFVLTIRDNGKGITDEAKSRPFSLGLLGMQERAHFIGGTIDITGVEGKGTTVTLKTPVSLPEPGSPTPPQAEL